MLSVAIVNLQNKAQNVSAVSLIGVVGRPLDFQLGRWRCG
ncbi:hypothetical protein JCM19239_5476 [Vibrio variabilis]|uniref:Uncharacterized protein n=1 Tax=Vibrio variabilis TaxID=990271 RepID=A0ABQ0JHI6_9VIBR|nr:hypothetical protein JCM19239_5476 [Vibrio variabilis]